MGFAEVKISKLFYVIGGLMKKEVVQLRGVFIDKKLLFLQLSYSSNIYNHLKVDPYSPNIKSTTLVKNNPISPQA